MQDASHDFAFTLRDAAQLDVLRGLLGSAVVYKDCWGDVAVSYTHLAQHAQDTAVLAGGKVTSESVGKWSRSIQQDDEQSGSFERRCLRIAAQYIPIRSGRCV